MALYRLLLGPVRDPLVFASFSYRPAKPGPIIQIKKAASCNIPWNDAAGCQLRPCSFASPPFGGFAGLYIFD